MRKFLYFVLLFLAIDFAHAKTRGIDLRYKRFEFQTGLGFGNYSAQDPYYNVAYKTTPTNYALGLYGGKVNTAWGLTATRGSFRLQDRPRQSFTMVGTFSYRLGNLNELQDYFFIGGSFRTLTYSRDLSLDGVTFDSTYISQLSPGLVLTHQKHIISRSFLWFNQLAIDSPIVATEKATPDLFSQVSGGFNSGVLAEISRHTGVGAELQIRFDRSGTMNGVDETYMSQIEGTILTRFMYIF
ncbi:MAG: hypothetical protein H7328_04160 [Bdellovibrio sp.]|nr:hypothetical protein [Bdellovibrio sp.]